MPATAFRRAMRHRVTVKRDATTTSASGATRFNYATLLSGVRCSLQDAGGRMRQDDVGQVAGRKKTAIFGLEMATVLQQNDLLVLENFDVGATYKIFHLHTSVGGQGSHVEASVEQLPSAGGD